jgi:peptidoglycan/xylan/chitin deacetylase (PgdA/CDA1 family)
MMGGVTTVTLPQNFSLNPGSVLDNIDTPTDWTAVNGSISADTTNYKVGTQSVMLTTASGGDATMTKTVAWNLSASKCISVWIYFGSPVAQYTSSVQLRLGSVAGMGDMYYAFKMFPLHNVGWNLFQFPLTWFIKQGNADWSNIIRIQIRVKGATSQTPSISVSKFTTGIVGVPVCLMRFDDGWAEEYTNCYSYMKQFRIRGTDMVVTNNIGTGGCMTAAQLIEMDSKGWAICNHTNDHTNLTTLTEANQETRLTGGMNGLNAIGLTRCSKYVGFPNAASNDNTLVAMTNTGMLAGGSSSEGILHGPTPYVPMVLPTENNLYSMITGFDCIYSAWTLAQMEGFIDAAIAAGVGITPQFHKVGTDADQLTAADFQTFVDYIRAKAKAGLIYLITYDDLYKATLGPVSIPKIL